MTDIGRGDLVRCVNASCDPWRRPVPLVEGAVYRVAEVFQLPHSTLGDLWQGTAFELEDIPAMEDPRDGSPLAWGAYRFVPLGHVSERVERRELADA